MRFATIAALGALAVVNAEYVPECGEWCMWPLPTQLVDSKCYGASYYTLNQEEMTVCFKAKMAMQMACGEQPGSPICQQEAARIKAGGPVDLKKKQEFDFGDLGNFGAGAPTELVDESCYSDSLQFESQEKIDQCVSDIMAFAIGCMFNETNDVCVEQAARDAARNAPLILKKKQEGEIDFDSMFDMSSLFPAPEGLVDATCTDPMGYGQLSQEDMDKCAQDLAAFALACAFNEANQYCVEQKAIDEARFGGQVALMSQSAATCEETSITRDVGLSAAMVAVGALATYGIMRRAKTTDDFQRV